MADDLKDNNRNYSGLPEGVKVDEYGNVIAPSERSKPAPRQLSADEKKEKRKADVLKLFEIKRLPTRFGRRQAALGEKMCATRSAYIEALQSDEEFLENLMWLENRNISGLTSELAYKLYKEGYEIEQQERADEANAANARRFSKFQFNNKYNIEKFIQAIQILLYNADPKYIKTSVIKLVQWLQWFRYGLIPEKEHKRIVTPSALIFYSSRGGTGKTEILKAFCKACEQLNISTENFSSMGITGRFLPDALFKVKSAVISDIDWFGKFGRDVNLDVLNNIIDRLPVEYERKGKDVVPRATALSVIGATNVGFSNRRYSFIPFLERRMTPEVIAKINAPKPLSLVFAWGQAILNCPDPAEVYHDITLLNSKAPHAVDVEIMYIYDYFVEHGEQEVSVRKLIKYLFGRDKESPRRRDNINTAIKQLLEQGILQISKTPPSSKALNVSHVACWDINKFAELVAADDPEEIKQISDDEDVSQKIAKYINKLYVIPLWDKVEAQIVKLETKKEALNEELLAENEAKKSQKLNYEIAGIENEISHLKELSRIIQILTSGQAPDEAESGNGPPDSS